MAVLSLDNVVKQYSNHRAVDGVTFDVEEGSIFGLLGPNGAGKTSLIRIITTITAADEGTVMINGEPLNSRHPSQIGYLPEERGLYKKMEVGDQLLFLAQLKGLEKRDAKKKIDFWFERFEITDWWTKKVQELSKGMQQKIQFISTVVHEPKLLILDEPFSGLDPINTNLIKDEIYRLNQEGTSIIFSTHRMEQVEEVCEDIVLINQGRVVLNGKVNDIKETYKENIFRIGYKGSKPSLSSNKYSVISQSNDDITIQMTAEMGSNELLNDLIRQGVDIDSYNEIKPTINEIFIKKVGETNE
ncbi:MAG: ATP-binding cassette domain-containing protein [Saprospiraceae bacterium]|nr:ATP-binding cassette domain-containing protein [Saprospiraceae bacterium]|tara:strand:+ start:1614 stop:2516 length:903 start_codon:yes stop_codon:yes gene_type:complete